MHTQTHTHRHTLFPQVSHGHIPQLCVSAVWRRMTFSACDPLWLRPYIRPVDWHLTLLVSRFSRAPPGRPPLQPQDITTSRHLSGASHSKPQGQRLAWRIPINIGDTHAKETHVYGALILITTSYKSHLPSPFISLPLSLPLPLSPHSFPSLLAQWLHRG